MQNLCLIINHLKRKKMSMCVANFYFKFDRLNYLYTLYSKVNILANILQYRNMLRNIFATPCHARCISKGTDDNCQVLQRVIKIASPMYLLCLCIHASLSPEMNSLSTVRNRRRWRNRESAYPGRQQTVKRV